ncbi:MULTISPECIES: hypothetical protein [unclassified Microbacterium]|uniref:arsenate reductase/protein-tyrosine-phosphatase family protein n=1 Tax=unclassified Microbacterium TaxID=2609290 RepID=UPI0012F81D15|nr:hypothetical protein [Microbacterium sp. MAH-37]MVQ42670.1 hypothetical protein [Microbacterium sp. MAH-37]
MTSPPSRRSRRERTQAASSSPADDLRAQLAAFFAELGPQTPADAVRQTLSVHVVGTGDVCRSPLAAALLARRFAQAGTPAHIDSSGVSAQVGAPADRLTQLVAREHGVDLSSHRARPFDPASAVHAALVLTVTRQQREAVIALLPAATRRVFTLREFAEVARPLADAGYLRAAHLISEANVRRQLRSGAGDDILDPIGRGEVAHRAVSTAIATAVDTVAGVLIRTAGGRR